MSDHQKAIRVLECVSLFWGTEFAAELSEELERCATEEEIAQLCDLYLLA